MSDDTDKIIPKLKQKNNIVCVSSQLCSLD